MDNAVSPSIGERELPRGLELLRALVELPSVEGSDARSACLGVIERAVAGWAGRAERVDLGGLEALVVRFGGRAAEEALIFAGHVNVVPPGGEWRFPPYAVTVDGTRLVGRGVCDMKGGIAAFVTALGAVHSGSGPDGPNVSLVLTCDEEVGSARGMIPLLETGRVTGAAAICGEPTGLRVFTGNRGVLWLRVVVRGRGGHAGQSHLLLNPVNAAARIVGALEREPLIARNDAFDPPRPSLCVTTVDAGATDGAINIIPEEVRLAIDRRILPGEDAHEVAAALERTVRSAVPDAFTVQVSSAGLYPPYMVDDRERVVGLGRRAVASVGRPTRTGTDSAANDSSWLHAAGIPTILLGPGAPGEAHTLDEGLEIDEFRDAIGVYAHLISAWGS